MLQFEIWRLLAPPGESRNAPRVVVLQHPHLRDLETCVVAPLRTLPELPALGRLRPEITVGRKRYRLIVDRLSVVSRKVLVERIGSAEQCAEPIKRALDELFYGN